MVANFGTDLLLYFSSSNSRSGGQDGKAENEPEFLSFSCGKPVQSSVEKELSYPQSPRIPKYSHFIHFTNPQIVDVILPECAS